jgi:type II secretory pathway pseudopilin PulG
MRRLRRRLRREGGYSLVELVTVMLILGTILGAITTVFVQGSNAELESNRRFQGQLQATAAFDRLRRDIHCASSTDATSGTPVSTITLSGCAAGDITWRACGGGTRYALYRNTSTCPTIPASCATAPSAPSTGKLYADCLTSGLVFTYYVPVTDTSLAKVHADVRVNVNPAKTIDTFELVDDIVLRNSLRA